MSIRLATSTRNASAQVFQKLIDAAGSAGEIQLYSGPRPKSIDGTAIKDSLLGRLRFSFPSAEESSDGSLTFLSISDEDSAPSSGKAAWARIVDGAGKTVFDCDITEEGKGGTIELNTTTIVAGGPIRLRSFSLVVPAG